MILFVFFINKYIVTIKQKALRLQDFNALVNHVKLSIQEMIVK